MRENEQQAVWGPPPERESIGAAVYRRLREAILSGRIPMGARINELELASVWKISRTPIRDALRRLEAEGLVQAASGRGMIVPVLTRSEVEELYEVRQALEGVAARRAAERATPEFLTKLNTLIKAYGTAVKQEDMRRLLVVDDDLHTAIVQMAQNRRLQQAIHGVRMQLHRVHVGSFRLKGRAATSFREKARLVAAIRSMNPARAEAAMQEHLASLRADLVENFAELETAERVAMS